METFSALLVFCAGNSPVPGEFPSQRPVTRSFDVFCHLCLNKRLSKQSWGWWFQTPSRSLWRHRNAFWKVYDKAIHNKQGHSSVQHTSPQRKYQFEEIFATGCTGSCQYDNFQSWRKFRQDNDISAVFSLVQEHSQPITQNNITTAVNM